MTQALGHRWTANFGESATNEQGALTDTAQQWAEALGDLTGRQVANGVRAAFRADSKWWPTAGGFREMCLAKSKARNLGLDYVPEYYRADRILDRSRLLSSDDRERRREVARQQLQSLREALKGGDSNAT